MAEKILIVDDDLETLRLIGVMLQRQGYQIIAANTGELAIKMVKSETPDLVILDVVMPGIDGFHVASEIRQDPATSKIPILMFTAKNQVDDKMTGYDAGADDYLTKPVHPAELTAHVKNLLARTAPPSFESGRNCIIGVVGCKGGLGASTLALNLAISYANLSKQDVLAVELRPGVGSWGIELDIPQSYGLEKILPLPLEEITSKNIERYAVHTSYGIRLLTASNKPQNHDTEKLGEKLLAVVTAFAEITPVLVLDIGNPFLPYFEDIVSLCDNLLLLTDGFPSTVQRTRLFLDQLTLKPSEKQRNLDIILYNHVRADTLLTAEQVTKMLPGNPIRVMIPAVPELVFQSNQKNVPLIRLQPDSLFTSQVNELAGHIYSHANK